MSDKPPVRQNWSDSTPTDIDPEVKEQIEARKRRKAEEEKNKRPKATYDLPKALIEVVQDISDSESVPRSDIAAWALIDFVERYQAGNVDLESHKKPTRSLRYLYKLELPGDW